MNQKEVSGHMTSTAVATHLGDLLPAIIEVCRRVAVAQRKEPGVGATQVQTLNPKP